MRRKKLREPKRIERESTAPSRHPEREREDSLGASPRGWRLGSIVLPLVIAVGCTCSVDGSASLRFSTGAASASASARHSPAAPSHVLDSTLRNRWQEERTACLERIDEATHHPKLPGAPEFEAARAQVLARAKGVPVWLLRAPRKAEELSARAQHHLEQVNRAGAKAWTLFQQYPSIVRDPRVAREVLLSEGYLFASHSSLAFGLSHVVKLGDLFDEPRIWLQRAGEVYELERRQRGKERYYARVGDKRAEPVSILFLDRVATKRTELQPPLHRDLLPLRARLGFDSAEVRHLSFEQTVLDVRYGELVVPTLVSSREVTFELQCEAIPVADRQWLEQRRAEYHDWWSNVEQLRASMLAQLDEGLPFDEPRTEVGQQDGKLRDAWRQAYFEGRDWYSFNGDRYPVFGSYGQPAVPQVCIDFIADTLERASGTGYRSRGEPRERTTGGLDFNELDLDNRRRVPDFLRFVSGHPEWFDVWQPEQLVPLRSRRRFYQFVEQYRTQFLPGDIVVIYGMRDDEQPHYHSFFVFESDPFTGMPIHLASNAVRPQVRTWEGEMHNAPRRSVRARIRPRATWLARVLGDDTSRP